ncbi:DNA primase [Polycyclovorans algicola]|uniref:DNA primase n=1 Tax=Polycyclovorans algicola TaxID=616992 RepID=UPI0004A6C554|nr:DNA primase [Polycyclovorans algicola]
MSGRIPDSFIQDLLARTDILELIGARVELKRAGKEWKGCSPFTHEKTPSFFVSPTKQMYFDFSSGKNGNAIGFLMEHDRLSFVDAVEALAQMAGLDVPREGGHVDRLVLEGPLDALAVAQRHFRDQLRQSPDSQTYLRERGVTAETAKAFGLGFAPDRWDALAAHFTPATLAHAVSAGLLIERDGGGRPYDRFRGRIMFPIRDARGRVIAYGGRTVIKDPAKYLNSPETPLFHKGRELYGLFEAKAARKAALPHVLVVEGYMDVVMLHQAGITDAVATLGTATTRDHLQRLFRETTKVIFCFDGDAAGGRAAWRALEQALPELHGARECRFMFLPQGHDPDSLIQAEGRDAFEQRIKDATPLSTYLIETLTEQAPTTSIEGRARFVALAQPHLRRVPEGPFKSLLTDALAATARLSADQLADDATAPSVVTTPATPKRSGRASGQTLIIKGALRALLERPALAERAQHVEAFAAAALPGLNILTRAIDYFQSHPNATAAQLLESWRDSKEGEALMRVMAEPSLLDDDALAREFDDALDKLWRGIRRSRYTDLLNASTTRSLSGAEQQELGTIMRELNA